MVPLQGLYLYNATRNVLVPSSLFRHNQSLLGRKSLLVSPCDLQLCCTELILANWVSSNEIGF